MKFSELVNKVQYLTATNFHGEALTVIAEHYVYPALVIAFQRINDQHNELGYLSCELNDERYKLYQELMLLVELDSTGGEFIKLRGAL